MKNLSLRRTSLSAVAAVNIFGLVACSGGVVDPNAGGGGDADETVAEASLVSPIPGASCEEGGDLAGEPIVVGGSMSLTGALAPTGLVHEQLANIVVDWVNKCGGINGQLLEYRSLDDQSTPLR